MIAHAACLMATVVGVLGCQPAPTGRVVLSSGFDADASRWANMSPLGPGSESEWSPTAGRAGGGIRMKGAGGAPDQQRMWKRLIHDPPTGRTVRISAWARGRSVDTLVSIVGRAAPAPGGLFDVAASSQVETPVRGDFDWRRLAVTMDVPRGCKSVQVLLLLVGNGEAWFDDVLVEDVGEAALLEPGVYELRVECRAGAEGVIIPLPGATTTCTPLEASLEVDPPARLRGARVVDLAGGGHGVEVMVGPGEGGARVVLTSQVLASAGEAVLPERVAMPERWPDEAAAFVQEGVPMPTDAIGALTRCVSEFGSGDVADRLAARLVGMLRSSGLPARVTPVIAGWRADGRALDLAEVYVPGPGWTLIEPGLGRVGWPRHAQWEIPAVPARAGAETMRWWRPVRNVPEGTDPGTWERMRAASRVRWERWLGAHRAGLSAGRATDWWAPGVEVVAQLSKP